LARSKRRSCPPQRAFGLTALLIGGLIAYLAAGRGARRVPCAAPRAAVRFRLRACGRVIGDSRRGCGPRAGGVTTWDLPSGVPLFSWAIRVNPLSAYFNLALGILATAVSIYSFGYVRQMEDGETSVSWVVLHILLLSLTLVFVAGRVLFLVAWEVMALAGVGTGEFRARKERTRRAGMLFLIMSHAGSGLLLVGFLILARASGSLDSRPSTTPPRRFRLAARRGVPAVLSRIRREGWSGPSARVAAGGPPRLAEQHLRAGCPASVIKDRHLRDGAGVLRFLLRASLGGDPGPGAGVVSALLGVLYALMEHDLKRLLAYHSIENIGII